MTARDFILIGDVIREVSTDFDDGDTYTTDILRAFVDGFADRLALDNPRFDRDRFVAFASEGIPADDDSDS